MIGRIAAAVAGVAPGKQALEVVKGEPELVERSTGKCPLEQVADRVADPRGIADLHGVCDVVFVTAILGHETFLLVIGRIARFLLASVINPAAS